MTQPVQVPIDVQVSGTDAGVDQLNDLQQALAGVTIGAGAMDVGLRQAQQTTQRGTFGSRGLAEAAAYQSQMSGINATVAVTRQSMSGLNNDVLTLSRSMPGGTQQMIATVQATQQLGLSQRGQVNQIRALSGEYTKLAAATGSYAPAVATQFGDLNRQLASLDPGRVSRFADVVTSLQAKTGANASGMLSFAQSISPVAQQAGLGESAILGISSSFVKLGDDGGAAATAVNKILGDLNSSVREGSSQMVAYANATGMTVKQFKALFEANPAAALEKVTSQLGQPTAQSTYLLQTLGLDSTRTQRAFSELGQSGGLQATINTAVGSYGNGATARGAAAALGGVNDRLQQLHTTTSQLGMALEGPLLRPLEKFLGIVQAVASPLAGAVQAVSGSKIGGGALEGLGTAAFLGFGGAHLLFGAGRRMLGPAWAATLGTSGPAMSALAGFRTGRGGAETSLMNESGMLGFVGRRQNSMQIAGMDPEAQMGRRAMSGINRGTFGFFQGLGEQYGPGGTSPMTPRASLTRRLVAGGATAASLANQGYWRMLQQPLVQMHQDPLDREFNLTQAGGPGRRLLTGLKDSVTSRDMGIAKDALHDFNTEVGGGSKALNRFVGTMGEASKNILSAGFSVGRGALGAGARGVGGFLADNPLLVAGGAAIAGYSLYKHAEGNAQSQTAGADPSQMYGVLNKYRDSMGEAGVAAVNLAQQLNDAAKNVSNNVTTLAQASHVTSADTSAWGLRNSNKTVNRMTGTTSQIVAQIQQFHAGKAMTPADLQGIGHDLYNQGYSVKEINAVLGQVAGGPSPATTTGNITSTIDQASYQSGERHRGFWDKLGLTAGRGLQDAIGVNSSAWANVGRSGGGSPSVTGTGKAELNNLSLGILQTANANAASGGGRYATGMEVKQANTALSEALKTHNASLVVATEQELTRTLTGKAIKGLSAQDIQNAAANHPASLGPLGSVLQGHGSRVNDLLVTQGLLGSTKQHQTAAAITALAGTSNSIFAPYFGGNDHTVQHALNQPDNARASQMAGAQMITALTKSGDSLTKIAEVANRNLNITGPQGNVISQVYAQAQQRLAFGQISMTPASALTSTIQQGLAQGRALPANASTQQIANQQTAIGTTLPGAYQQLTNSYQQRLQAQFNYQVQAKRSDYDFNLQVSRADQDFHIQDLRNQQDYYRQKLYATQDYNISVKRAVLAAATSGDYDPYTRIQTAPVFGGEDLLNNVKEQDDAIKQQELNLNKVRNMGLSGVAVQTLGLAQTANAQQLQQLVDDFASNPQLIQQMNTEIGKRVKGAGKLYKDPGDTSYVQQQQDFVRQMARGKTEFDTAQTRLQQDFQRQNSRALADHETTMSRMTQDLHDSDLAITGDMKSLQKATMELLTGNSVDFKNLQVNNLKEMLHQTKKYVPLIVAAENQGFSGALPSSAGGGGGTAPSTVITSGGGVSGGGNAAYVRAGGTNKGSETLDSSPGAVYKGGGQAVGNNPVTSKKTGKKTWVAAGTGATANPQYDTDGDLPALAWQQAHPPNEAFNKGIAKSMAKSIYGWGDKEYDALNWIWGGHESGWSQYAYAANIGNPPPAYGIPQSRPGNKMSKWGADWRTNPATQIKWGLDYIHETYGKPTEIPGVFSANWKGYKAGGIAMTPHVGVVAEAGSPEAMIPLNNHGIAYLAQAMSKYISSADAANIVSGGRGNSITINANHYEQHYGHTITEAKIVANSPKEIWDAMDKKVRMDNLTGPRGVRKNSSTG